MKTVKRVLAVFMVGAMLLTGLSGCSNTAKNNVGTNSSNGEQTDGKQVLERVDLNIYLMGDPPAEKILNQFYEKLDEITLRDFNCTVRFKFSTWTDYGTKYNLMRTTDNTIDMVYSAGWLDYSSYASKDAFLPLDELLPEYAPDIWNLISTDKWNALRIKGSIYGIPSNNQTIAQHGVAYREDLRKKYNLPEIVDVDTLGQYLMTVKEKEPEMQIPLHEVPFFVLFAPSSGKYEYFDRQGEIGSAIALVYDIQNPMQSVIQYETPEYTDFVKKMKEWADAGLWSKSVLSGNEDPEAKMKVNQGAAWVECNIDKVSDLGFTLMEGQKDAQPDWEIGFFPYENMNGQTFFALSNSDLMAVPVTAPNPERALMVLNKFMTDQEYYDLTQYGIKGLTYNVTEDGRLDYSGLDTTDNSLKLSAWAWNNTDLHRKNIVEWEKKYTILDELTSKASVDPFDGFALDLTRVQAEQAALMQVYAQYGKPLEAGFTENPEKDIAVLKEKMDAAGMQKFKAEVDRQMKEFIEAKQLPVGETE